MDSKRHAVNASFISQLMLQEFFKKVLCIGFHWNAAEPQLESKETQEKDEGITEMFQSNWIENVIKLLERFSSTISNLHKGLWSKVIYSG